MSSHRPPATGSRSGPRSPRTRWPARASLRRRARNVTGPPAREHQELRRYGVPSRTTSARACRASAPPLNSSVATCRSMRPARCPTARLSMSPHTSTRIHDPIFGARRTIGHTAIHHRMSPIPHGLTTRRLRMYRRGFLGRLAATAAAGVAGLTPLRLEGQPRPEPTTGADPSFETWLNRNNENYGTKDTDNSAVIVLRHSAIPIAMQDALWTKYKLGEAFSIKDGDAPATRNLFLKVMPLPLPGTGLEALLASGAQVGCCNVALTVYSAMVAQKMGMDAAAVKADWVAGLIPGVQVVPSGVLAVARSQEKGCAYCFAG